MRGQVVPPAIPVGTLGVPPAIPVGTTGDSSAPRRWAPADRETPRARAQHGLRARAQKTARRGRVRRGAPGTIPIPGSAVLARIHPVFAEYGETPPHGLRTQSSTDDRMRGPPNTCRALRKRCRAARVPLRCRRQHVDAAVRGGGCRRSAAAAPLPRRAREGPAAAARRRRPQPACAVALAWPAPGLHGCGEAAPRVG